MLRHVVSLIVGISLILGSVWLYRNPERLFPKWAGNETRRIAFARFVAMAMICVFSCVLLSEIIKLLTSRIANPLIVLPLAFIVTYLLVRRREAVPAEHKSDSN